MTLILQPFEQQTSRLALAGLANQGGSGRPIIALHGWLDNAASFKPLAGELNTDRPFYSLEMPGHGLSEHRAASSYYLVENIVDVLSFVNEICDEGSDGKFDLIGHSMGGIVAALVAASAPERVGRLMMLDSLGPYTDGVGEVLPQLRKAVEKASRLTSSELVVYPSLELAERARMMGMVKVSREAAELLVERGVKEVEGGYSWSTDPRLMIPSMIRFSEKQVKELYEGLECPVCLIGGKDGYLSAYEGLENRLSYIKNLEKHLVSGGHHFHMDGDVKETARLVHEFLEL